MTYTAILEELKKVGSESWENLNERNAIINALYDKITDWREDYENVNLRTSLSQEKIELLLTDSVKNMILKEQILFGFSGNKAPVEEVYEPQIIKFVARSGYKDAPINGPDRRPLTVRTTPVHHAVKIYFEPKRLGVIPYLFQIYDRDRPMNYTDELGFTHFHAACMSGLNKIVKKFLERGKISERGRYPNLIWQATGDSPLHMAMKYQTTCNTLLMAGANPNWANRDGSTPLHVICTINDPFERVRSFFVINDGKNQPVLINARDRLGNTPLLLALKNMRSEVNQVAVYLLDRGADPNLADQDGWTPLHIICKRARGLELLQQFLEVSDSMEKQVQLDAVDRWGQTPLKLAVANLLPEVVDVLLERGADDLSSFVFPNEKDFRHFAGWPYKDTPNDKLILVSRALAVIERLEAAKFSMELTDAVAITKILNDRQVFKYRMDLVEHLLKDASFVEKARNITVKNGLSYYKFLQLCPEEAAKEVTRKEFFNFVKSGHLKIKDQEIWKPRGIFQTANFMCLSEKLLREFCFIWAPTSFYSLISNRMPIEICEEIVKPLTNQDLCNIILATERQ